MQNQWLEICKNLEKLVDQGTYHVWFEPLNAQVEADALHLQAPNIFMAEWLKSRQIDNLRAAASPVLGLPVSSINIFITASPVTSVDAPQTLPARRAVQTTLPLLTPKAKKTAYCWRYKFEDFVEGASNRIAVAAARDICRKGSDLQTVFVNSASGLGKTHLSQAVGAEASAAEDGQRVTYLTAEEFASGYVAALHNKDIEGFKSRLKQTDVLLLEDVHFFRDKFKIQETALNVVKDIQSGGGRVVFTSSFSPRELQKVDSQLVSYFCSGIVTSMGKPNREMRREILVRKAKNLHLSLPESVEKLLASRLKGDVRQLESCLQSMEYKARLLNCPITDELALDVLSQYAASESPIDLALLTSLVCECYGLDEAALGGRSRKQANVMARNTVYFLARRHTDSSLDEIGKHFNRSHSTVLKGITTIERALTKQSTLGRQIASTLALVERQAGLVS